MSSGDKMSHRQKVLQRRPNTTSNHDSPSSLSSRPAIQRAAEEGMGGQDFSRVPTHSPGTGPASVQRKLTVNPPNDMYEQEADRVANSVMRMPLASESDEAPADIPAEVVEAAPAGPLPALPDGEMDEEAIAAALDAIMSESVSGGAEAPLAEEGKLSSAVAEGAESAPVQAKGSGAGPVSADVESSIGRMQGGGQPLPDSDRAFFESRMGADFSRVRVHTDSNAIQTSRQIQARAFTVGNNIAFNGGEYQPGTSQGRHLLAHELTHVMQQGGAPQSAMAKRISPLGTPSVQASFLSFVLKQGAKQAAKKLLQEFLELQIKQVARRYLNRRVAMQFVDKADTIMGVLTDPWWVTAIGFIPVVGDAFDLARVPMQIRDAIARADRAEQLMQTVLRAQQRLGRTLTAAPAHKLVKYLENYTSRTFQVGSQRLHLTKERMKHIFERHHPEYWDGSVKDNQSFLDPKMDFDDVSEAINAVLSQNRAQLIRQGDNIAGQVQGTHNGVTYVLGLSQGRIGQFYPLN